MSGAFHGELQVSRDKGKIFILKRRVLRLHRAARVPAVLACTVTQTQVRRQAQVCPLC